jgi:hypothetical protein
MTQVRRDRIVDIYLGIFEGDAPYDFTNQTKLT